MKMGAPFFAFFAKGGHDAARSADFDFAGAPSFAQFAKGGNHERIRNGVCRKDQSRIGSISIHLCKKGSLDTRCHSTSAPNPTA
jgi:hypothetical protein